MKKSIAIVVGCFLVLQTNAVYSGVWDKVKSKTQERVDRKTDEGIDTGLDKVEEGLTIILPKNWTMLLRWMLT